MGRNRKLRLTSGPSTKGQVEFRPLSGDPNPKNGVTLIGPDSVGASPLTLTLPSSVVNNGVLKSDGSGVLSTALILDANVAAGAALALSKLAALTASRALTSDGSGVISASAVTSTELSYLSGVTSSIQTQLDSKQSTGNFISALTGDVTATGPGSVAATIANGSITNAKVNASAAIDYSKLALANSVKASDIDSEATGSGRVLTSDGSGNATWETASVASYSFIGAAYMAVVFDVFWSAVGGVLVSPGASASGTPPVRTIYANPGPGTIDTTAANTCTFTVNSLPAGTYKVDIDIELSAATGSNRPICAINDGTTTSPLMLIAPSDTECRSVIKLTGFFTYGSTGNRTFEVWAAEQLSGTNALLDLRTREIVFTIWKVST